MPVLRRQKSRIPAMRRRISRVQLDRRPEFVVRRSEVVVMDKSHGPEGDVRFGKLGVQLRRARSRRLGARQKLASVPRAHNPHEDVSLGQTGQSCCVIGMRLKRSLEVESCLLQRFGTGLSRELLTTLQVKLLGLALAGVRPLRQRQWVDEDAIAAFRERLQKTRLARIVAARLAQLVEAALDGLVTHEAPAPAGVENIL